jgi:hypothetical protein
MTYIDWLLAEAETADSIADAIEEGRSSEKIRFSPTEGEAREIVKMYRERAQGLRDQASRLMSK